MKLTTDVFSIEYCSCTFSNSCFLWHNAGLMFLLPILPFRIYSSSEDSVDLMKDYGVPVCVLQRVSVCFVAHGSILLDIVTTLWFIIMLVFVNSVHCL